MFILAGIGLGAGIALFARKLRFDRDRSFYPTVLIVIAAYYVLFAVIALQGILVEVTFAAIFVVMAVIGYQFRPWLVGFGLILHGVFDAGHPIWLANSGVPDWWPGFCLGVDVILGVAALWTGPFIAGDTSSAPRTSRSE